jgi:citrate lyase beta subunit
MEGRPRRSALYMPGSNERALEKAKTIPADALIFDLEDAVAPDAKVRAREQVCAAVKNGGYGGREVVIRVNALETPWGTDDLIAACDAAPDAILVPKVVHSGDIISAAKILQSVHAPEKVRLWAMMETPMAILNARTIAATAVYKENRLCCLVMGTNDLIKESRARALHDRFAVVPWLAMTLVAARAYKLDILDARSSPATRSSRRRKRRSTGRARSSTPLDSQRTSTRASSSWKATWSSASISPWPSAPSPSPSRSARWRGPAASPALRLRLPHAITRGRSGANHARDDQT